MKGLKEFLELLKEDKSLLEEVKKVQDDSAKIVEIAKKHGYEFTEEELNDAIMEAVAGGGNAFLSGLWGMAKDAGQRALQGAAQGVQAQFTSGGQQGQNNPSGFSYYEQGGQVYAYNNATGQRFVAQGWNPVN